MAVKPEDDKTIIDEIADKQLGMANKIAGDEINAVMEKEAATANLAGGAGEGVAEAPTPLEQSAEAVSPKTEADMVKEEAFIKVNFGEGDDRTLSDKQIKDTYDRYRDLNFKHQTEIAPMRPVLDFANEIARSVQEDTGQPVGADDIVQFLTAASRAYMSNPTMGGAITDPTPDTAGIPLKELQDDMAAWEEENAVSLPPRYKEAADMMQKLQDENAQIRQMLGSMANQTQGLAETTQQQVQQADSMNKNSTQQLMANNLDYAQKVTGLADDAQEDFFDFAYGRGYTLEDFVDKELTVKVATDFKNERNSPEMERLKGIATRRQAFTGNVATTPGASGVAPDTASPDESFINSVADEFMQKRNMG
jgi:uncharacterized membrane-anchored protein YhcB (DUF1043 family)